MLQPVDLGLERLVQFRPAVAVDIGPHGGDTVQVALAVRIDQPASLAPGDDDRLIPLPILHLGKGVPDMLPVPLPQLFSRIPTHTPSSRRTISVSACPSSQSASPSTSSSSSISSRCGQIPSTGAPHRDPIWCGALRSANPGDPG